MWLKGQEREEEREERTPHSAPDFPLCAFSSSLGQTKHIDCSHECNHFNLNIGTFIDNDLSIPIHKTGAVEVKKSI